MTWQQGENSLKILLSKMDLNRWLLASGTRYHILILEILQYVFVVVVVVVVVLSQGIYPTEANK